MNVKNLVHIELILAVGLSADEKCVTGPGNDKRK